MIGRTNAGGGLGKSTLIVECETGSAVTVSKGSSTKTANERYGIWTFPGLEAGSWTVQAVRGGRSASKTVAMNGTSSVTLVLQYRVTPEFTYTGSCKTVDDNDNVISDFANWTGNWKIRFLTSGTFKITNMHGFAGAIDVFLVGGGGSGGSGVWESGYVQSDRRGGGGGSGYTSTLKNVAVSAGVSYSVSIGAGAASISGRAGAKGGGTTAFNKTVSGGYGTASDDTGMHGGKGGSGGGNENYDGASDGGGGTNAGAGQGTTTREFGASSGKLYATGGSGKSFKNGTANTGDGGSGGKYADTNGGKAASGGSGGSGIVIIRNKR